jgi:hypothetical protein
VADEAGERAGDERARVAGRREVGIIQHGVAAAAQDAVMAASALASTATRRVRCSALLFRFDHERAMATLSAYEVDLVLVFRPPFLPNFQPLMSLRQRLVALMPADHPLAGRTPTSSGSAPPTRSSAPRRLPGR